MTDHERELDAARGAGAPDRLAEALLARAGELVVAGRFAEARAAIDEAGAIHHDRARPEEEARCCHFAATLLRLEGRLDDAERRADRATRLAAAAPTLIAAWSELGEIALARRDALGAAVAYRNALAEGDEAGLADGARALLLRRTAQALAGGELHAEAARELGEARAAFARAGDRTGELRTTIEQAAAFERAGDAASATERMAAAEDLAGATGDRGALADLALMRAAREVAGEDLARARSTLATARDHALAAVAPLAYVAAVIGLSDVAARLDDRVAAYGALAAGWVTLADLLGRDVAVATFQPRLIALRERWGANDFAVVKAAYEAQRRELS